MTPTPTPRPTPETFGFEDDAMGWSFTNQVPQFEPVFARYNSTLETLDIVTNGNENSFGFWERVTVFDTHTTGSMTVFRATWDVQSDLPDTSVAPVVRFRTSTQDFSQSNVLVVTSSGNGNASPPTTGREYVQYFTLPEEDDPFRLSFDVLNFDPSDTVFSRISLAGVTIESIAEPSGGTVDFGFDFQASGTNGFTELPVVAALPTPSSYSAVIGEGLGLRGRNAGEAVPNVIFGYWGSVTPRFMLGNTLYKVEWTVGSNATEATAGQLPTIRLRMNDSSFKFSTLLNLESVGAYDLPTLGNSKSYDQWIMTPAEVGGENWVFSFDYLYTTSADNAQLKIILEDLTVTRY